jgi:hypothetical protein
MSDNPKYKVDFSGTFTQSQFSVGDHAALTMTAGAAAASRLSDAQLAELRSEIAKLAEDVEARVPDGQREAALQQVEAIAEATIGADEVDVPRLKRVTRWFAKNAPELAEGVTGLLFGPVVGALVGRAGGLAAALLGGDEDEDAG